MKLTVVGWAPGSATAELTAAHAPGCPHGCRGAPVRLGTRSFPPSASRRHASPGLQRARQASQPFRHGMRRLQPRHPKRTSCGHASCPPATQRQAEDRAEIDLVWDRTQRHAGADGSDRPGLRHLLRVLECLHPGHGRRGEGREPRGHGPTLLVEGVRPPGIDVQCRRHSLLADRKGYRQRAESAPLSGLMRVIPPAGFGLRVGDLPAKAWRGGP